ncbi:MAG: hypothetical protein HY682_01070 [Chloroflexi bacterium]|nr:hypothetical protein [Chloroflexota bacterium]
MRDDFADPVKRAVAARVANRCSRPECRATTSGPQVDSDKAISLGVAAHISAAAAGGPRFDPALQPEERSSADNAIWLCQNCAKLVDNDEARFPRDLLREWKSNAEAEALSVVGRPVDSTVTEPDPARMALMDHRFEMVCDDYKVRGTPKLMVDTFNDLSIEGKAALYDRAVMWKKGRLPKDNPYRR